MKQKASSKEKLNKMKIKIFSTLVLTFLLVNQPPLLSEAKQTDLTLLDINTDNKIKDVIDTSCIIDSVNRVANQLDSAKVVLQIKLKQLEQQRLKLLASQ